MDTLSFLISDCVWLPLLELLVFIVFIRFIFSDWSARRRKGGTGGKITRGKESWESLFTFFGLSVVLISIINSSDLISGYKVIIGLVNVAVLFYLNICSVNFKNKLIGWKAKLRDWPQQI